MGFFNWMLKGLGIESEDSNKNPKKNKKVNKEPDKYAEFNLHRKAGEGSTPEPYVPNFNNDGLNSLGMERNFIIHEPKNHRDVQLIIDYLRQNQSAYINLANLNSQDAGRILDFLSGAIYGLGGSIYRIRDDQFVLTPAGSKILKPNEDKSNGEKK